MEKCKCEFQEYVKPRITEWAVNEYIIVEWDLICSDCGKKQGTEQQKHVFSEVWEMSRVAIQP